MYRLKQAFRNWFFRQEDPEEARRLAELKLAFKSRFHSFKLLLLANNNALENMAAMEKALADREPFDMPFVKARATAATVDVYRMIRNLDELAPGGYSGLTPRFNQIQQAIVAALAVRKPTPGYRLVIPFSEITLDDAERVGPKMARLCQVKNRLKLTVPAGFVITAAAYHRFLEHNDLQVEINRRFQIADIYDLKEMQATADGIEALMMAAEMPADVGDAIEAAYRDLESEVGRPFGAALRSSALGEDLTRTSFAGQYRSRLNVERDQLIRAYKEVVASKYCLRAILYRYHCGFRDEEISMCVGCMEMVTAIAGGVVYSRDPVDESGDSVIINAAWGLPKLVVDGRGGSDRIAVSRTAPQRITNVEVKNKESRIVCVDGGGIRDQEALSDQNDQLSLQPDPAIQLAEWALKMEAHFGSPQDIEWALSADGQLHVLQCRPLRRVVREERIHPQTETAVPDDRIIYREGITVSAGAGSGPAVVVEKAADMASFPPGAVLVTRLALPRWAPLLDRAAAVVTERGSFAGHLGTVAREFGVPALFEVAGATTLLKAAGEVTVDAGRRTVYQGRIESLLTRSEARQNLIEGSPVYETLKKVSRHIVPLHLLDPDAPEFQPAGCRTLHDITRFIHEKSVLEIFAFGREFRFSEKASKQLVCQVPMQWWVLNLDDGFCREIEGPTVHLEEICSIPMLALWEGMVAVPWEGPPRIDGRGLMSVMFQATANRALTVGGRNQIAEKNYFMISKNFCSLTSRLGFHFSTVESIISEQMDENYVCFQYRGGAADFYRRLGRVRFLGDILEENGFVVDIREDNLVARLEKREPEIMKNKLKILGYLTIHSRQLDMIMTNGGTVAFYREKFRRDLADLNRSEPDAGGGR